MRSLKLIRNLSFAVLAAAFTTSATAQDFRPWMHKDVQRAWNENFQGQRTRIITVDGFSAQNGGQISGNLTGTNQVLTHGGWTALQSSLIAPRAQVRTQDFTNTSAIKLSSKRMNVVNLSYGMIGAAGQSHLPANWSARERSIIDAARDGRAVVVQAAGNNGNEMEQPFIDQNGNQRFDFLSRDLAGLRGTIFVGALERNGTVSNPARIADYSARAGRDKAYRNKFLVVGVPTELHGLAGTSFAAPVVSGYAAILGSKFRDARPRDISRQLLRTARTDRIHNYKKRVHGRGEASLRRALAPVSIR